MFLPSDSRSSRYAGLVACLLAVGGCAEADPRGPLNADGVRDGGSETLAEQFRNLDGGIVASDNPDAPHTLPLPTAPAHPQANPVGSASAPPATGPASDTPELPYLASDFELVFTPSNGRYLNDHTLVRAKDGLWHLIGITNSGPGAPFEERSFLHATSTSLHGPWTERPDVLSAAESEGCCVWAPHVLETAAGSYTMFYATQQPGVMRASSPDLMVWQRTSLNQAATGRPPGGRDPYLMRDGKRWLLYSVGADAAAHGQIIVTTTQSDPSMSDMWTSTTPVLTDPVPSFGWGNLESPFVVERNGTYYLFVTRTGTGQTDYVRTLVFASRDPEKFEWKPLTRIFGHAAEVVSEDGQDYLTSAGWTSSVGELNRGLLLAKVQWTSTR
jgi:arabinan endo-1,5-alpha-L-arabinosidase